MKNRNLIEPRLLHNKLNMKIYVSLSMLAMVAAANAYVVFDDLSTNQNSIVLTSVGTASNLFSLGSINRLQQLNVVAYNDPDDFERAYSRVNGGYWIGSSDVDVQGIWSMAYTLPTVFLANKNTYALDFSSIDHNSVVNVTWTSGAVTATGQANVAASNAFQQVVVNATNIGSGFDWNNVTSVKFEIAGPAGLDFKVDKIETVPEPASMIALGLGGLALIRRKRKA